MRDNVNLITSHIQRERVMAVISPPNGSWGGARAGAGRKAKHGPTRSMRVPDSLRDQILDFIDSDGAALPYYATRVQAGFAAPADDSVDRSLSANDLVLNKATTFWFRATGKSMEPYIYEGDILMCDRSIKPINGDIILAAIEGELTIKSFRHTGGVMRLIPTNHTFPILDITEDMQFEVQGVVINIVRPTHERFRVDAS